MSNPSSHFAALLDTLTHIDTFVTLGEVRYLGHALTAVGTTFDPLPITREVARYGAGSLPRSPIVVAGHRPDRPITINAEQQRDCSYTTPGDLPPVSS